MWIKSKSVKTSEEDKYSPFLEIRVLIGAAEISVVSIQQPVLFLIHVRVTPVGY